MSRKPTTMKHVVELYLIIVGGAYALTALVGLLANTRFLLASMDAMEIRETRSDIGQNSILLGSAGLLLASGIGVRMYRKWGLILATGLGVCAIASAVVQIKKNPWDYHHFTIGLPMAGILVWSLLPVTWREFERGSLQTS